MKSVKAVLSNLLETVGCSRNYSWNRRLHEETQKQWQHLLNLISCLVCWEWGCERISEYSFIL